MRAWVKAPGVNRKILPGVNFSYGKDSMAVMILLKMAGIKSTALTVLNGGDLPSHELVFPEFDAFIGMEHQEIYRTEKRYVDYLVEAIAWGRKNLMTKKDGSLIDYWDMGGMEEVLGWNIGNRFWGLYGEGENGILILSGERGSEAMDRSFLFQRKGAFYQVSHPYKDGSEYAYWRGYPLHDWKDIDVWALLVSQNCPVSPIYSYHQIPQKGGKQSFPRTYWYPEPLLMNAPFYRWLAHYAPAQLKELTDYFPEILERIKPQTVSS